MAQERGTGALLKVKRGQGRESTFYGGSIYLTKASQKNLMLEREKNLERQSHKEYNYEVKQIYKKKLSLKQHLLHLQTEKERVTYLDGGSRGKPRSQWDTSIEDALIRNSKTVQRIRSNMSKSDESLSQNRTKREKRTRKYETKVLSGNSFEDESHLQLAEPTRSRVAAYGLFAVASEENLPLSIAERSFTVEGRDNAKPDSTRLPSIHDNQKIGCTRSELSYKKRPPELRYSAATLPKHEHPPVALSTSEGRKTLSRSLTDLKNFVNFQRLSKML